MTIKKPKNIQIMRFKVYNSSNISSGRKGESYIRLNRKSGSISLSKEAWAAIGIKEGVEVLQDEDHPTDWYIRASEAEDAIKTRLAKNNSTRMFNAVGIVRAVEESLNHLDLNGKVSIKIPVAKDPTEGNIHSIITKAAH
jgi:hypothetical protein